MQPRSVLAGALRRHVFREGAAWRIPLGIAQGLRVAVQPGQTASLHLYLGTAEAELAPHIRRLVRPGTRCLDVGGNNAYYAMIFARRSGTEVVSIDFDPEAIALARRNLALNPELAPLIRLQRSYVAERSVPQEGIATLDELLEQGTIERPDLIKMDIEGSELAVLQGATRLLAEHRPSLIIETHTADLERGVGDLLIAAGYRVTIVGQRRWLREGRPAAHNRWLVAE